MGEAAGRSAVWPALSLVGASPLVRTPNSPQRTQPSASQSLELAWAAMAATPHGIGSRELVWSLAEITPTRDLVTLACPTVSHHALTMCLPLKSIPLAHQGNTHHQVAHTHALRM